jgi:phosphatidylserine decarboxylase
LSNTTTEASSPIPLLGRLFLQEDLNFLLTNRIPRRLVTQFMGWFSRLRHPWLARLSIGVWRRFAHVDLDEAAHADFGSLHDCFIRELKPGARPVDPDRTVMVSPCDAIVGACGRVDGDRLFQTKGFPYTLGDLLVDPDLVARHRDGTYVTLRLTSGMYHRFHAPADCTIDRVTYVSGDTWNTNPIAVRRVEKLFCKNERAVIETTVKTDLQTRDQPVVLVAVASMLVASMRFTFLDVLLHLAYRGANVIPCDARFRRGDQLGWFEMGSTIIVFAPAGFTLCAGVSDGRTIRMGQPLLRVPGVHGLAS